MRHPELYSGSINVDYSPSSDIRPPSPATGEKGRESSRHPELVSGSQQASSAFTLAEVLITLGIIGVVAAMTIPSLIMGKERKELQAGLKKNYSALSQSLVMASNDAGQTILPLGYQGTLVKSAIAPHLKILQDCKLSTCIGISNVDNGDGNVLTFVVKNYKTYNKKKNVQTHYFDDGQFILNDGSLIMMENSGTLGVSSNNPVFITVDVNGLKKRPNTWGHDLFTFQLMDDGKLLPMGQEGTRYSSDIYCSLTSSDALNGIGCAYKALTEEDYWKKLP